MAHHRNADAGTGVRGRGVSRGLVGALLSLVLVAALVVVWFQLGDRIDREGDQAAGNCVEGPLEVPIIADPSIAEPLKSLAGEFTETNPVVRDHCITITVRPGDAKITLDGLAGRSWDPAAMGSRPAAWVPQSSIWSAELAAARPDAVDGSPASLVSTPVVLATAPRLADALRDSLEWGQLPTLQRRDGSLADVGLSSWGSLRLATPVGGAASDATVLAAQAVAMQVTRSPSVLNESDAQSPRVASSISALLTGAPQSPDGSPTGAAKAIAEADDPATSPIHAVAITEQSLYELTRDDKQARLAEVIPGGPTPIADYPVIRLAGEGVDPAHIDGVSDFFDFVRKPDRLRALTGLGFRGDAPRAEPTPTVSFPDTDNPMATPETAAVIAINRLVFGPGSGPQPTQAGG